MIFSKANKKKMRESTNHDFLKRGEGSASMGHRDPKGNGIVHTTLCQNT